MESLFKPMGSVSAKSFRHMSFFREYGYRQTIFCRWRMIICVKTRAGIHLGRQLTLSLAVGKQLKIAITDYAAVLEI